MINPKKLLLRNIIMMIFFLIFGIYIVIFKKFDSAYIGGFSGGLVVLIISLVRIIKMMKNPEYKKQVEIDSKDERTVMINNKTSSLTSFIFIMICAIAGMVSLFIGKHDYLYIFGSIIILHTLIYYIARFFISKKY